MGYNVYYMWESEFINCVNRPIKIDALKKFNIGENI